MRKVVIYTKSNCPFCVEAKALLEKSLLDVEEISVDDVDNRENFIHTYPSLKTMPQIFVRTSEDEARIGGCDALRAYYRKSLESPIDDTYGIFFNI